MQLAKQYTGAKDICSALFLLSTLHLFGFMGIITREVCRDGWVSTESERCCFWCFLKYGSARKLELDKELKL